MSCTLRNAAMQRLRLHSAADGRIVAWSNGNDATDDALGAKTMTNVLPDLTADIAAANARIAQLEALLKAQSQPRALTLKVSEKGALSIYGLGRFPVTLYAGQWERLLAATDQIKAFMTANASLLATRD